VLEALVAASIGSVAVVNRTPARAEALAVQYGASVRSAGLDALEQLVPEAGSL
jgi:glutamyl-tRNA reductase